MLDLYLLHFGLLQGTIFICLPHQLLTSLLQCLYLAISQVVFLNDLIPLCSHPFELHLKLIVSIDNIAVQQIVEFPKKFVGFFAFEVFERVFLGIELSVESRNFIVELIHIVSLVCIVLL